MAVEPSVTTLDQELAIARLLVRERWYRDTSEWEQLRSCYHPDDTRTRVNISWIDATADAFVRGSQEMAKQGTSAVHSITPAEITLNHHKAIAEAAASIMIRFTVASHEYELISYCRLMYRLSQVGGEWKINQLTVIYVRDMIIPVAPSATSFSPDVTGYRQSYKFLSWTLKHQQHTISQELPGIDRPLSVSHLKEEQKQWLSSN